MREEIAYFTLFPSHCWRHEWTRFPWPMIRKLFKEKVCIYTWKYLSNMVKLCYSAIFWILLMKCFTLQIFAESSYQLKQLTTRLLHKLFIFWSMDFDDILHENVWVKYVKHGMDINWQHVIDNFSALGGTGGACGIERGGEQAELGAGGVGWRGGDSTLTWLNG